MASPSAPAAPGAARNLMTAALFKNATSRSLVRMVSASNLTLHQREHHRSWSASYATAMPPRRESAEWHDALLAEDALVEQKAELCAALAGVSWLGWLLMKGPHRRTLTKCLTGLRAVPPNCDLQLLGKGIHHGYADAVKAT